MQKIFSQLSSCVLVLLLISCRHVEQNEVHVKELEAEGMIADRFMFQYGETRPGETSFLLVCTDTGISILLHDSGVFGSHGHFHFGAEVKNEDSGGWEVKTYSSSREDALQLVE